MTTTKPPASAWLYDFYVPPWRKDLSIHPHKLPESDALCERNGSETEPEMSSFTTKKLDPDPTGEDVWPLEREHRIGTCYLDPDTGETVMPADFFGEKELRWTHAGTAPETTAPADSCVAKCPVCLHELENDEGILCDHCGEPTGPGSFAVINGPGGVFVYHLPCYDKVYWGEQGAEDVEFAPLPAHMRATFDACLAICVAKNADYASSSDPLANFRACEQFGVKLTKGIMVRLSDKFARIGNLLDRGAKVREEAIADTIDDAVNYLAILKYALETETSAVTGKCRGFGTSPATASPDEDTVLAT